MVVRKTTSSTKNKEYGVALSGGGLISVSQLSMLSVIEAKIGKPSYYVGTSGGSIIAGLLASGVSFDDILQSFKDLSKKGLKPDYWYLFKGLFHKRDYINGFVNGNVLENGIDNLTDYKRLAEVQPRLGIVATDINSGQEVIFTNVTHHEDLDESKIRSRNYTIFPNSYERVAHVVHASCSFPGIFIPTNVSGLNLVDGGVTDNLGSDIAYAMGAKKVISIDLGYSGRSKTQGLYDVLNMSLHILTRRNVEDNKGTYGLYLDPHIYDVNFLDASKIDEVYNRGKQYAEKVLNEVTSYVVNDKGSV